jgi:hypothetical protein
MKTTSLVLALLSSLTLVNVAHAKDAAERGQIAVQGTVAKAVVAGPVAFHAYSEFSGATIFVVAAVTGTDRDCAGARIGGAVVAADRVQTFTVGAGQLACVATSANGGSELLWHAQRERAASAVLLATVR